MKKRFLMPEAYWDTALLERWLEEKSCPGLAAGVVFSLWQRKV